MCHDLPRASRHITKWGQVSPEAVWVEYHRVMQYLCLPHPFLTWAHFPALTWSRWSSLVTKESVRSLKTCTESDTQRFPIVNCPPQSIHVWTVSDDSGKCFYSVLCQLNTDRGIDRQSDGVMWLTVVRCRRILEVERKQFQL